MHAPGSISGLSEPDYVRLRTASRCTMLANHYIDIRLTSMRTELLLRSSFCPFSFDCKKSETARKGCWKTQAQVNVSLHVNSDG